jgi:hypothetical protein
MLKGTLSFLGSRTGRNALRTSMVDGFTFNLPRVGQSFLFYSEPLERGRVREIHTSPVVEIVVMEPGLYRFQTENSTYLLKVR